MIQLVYYRAHVHDTGSSRFQWLCICVAQTAVLAGQLAHDQREAGKEEGVGESGE